VGRVLGLNKTDLMTIRVGAYLHDVGKVRVPHEILNKPGPLTPTEFAAIKRHPEWGVDLLENAEFPWDIKPIIRWHHEKLDGSGYPYGLRGGEIPLAAQIICVSDVYDALTSDRSYRPARTKQMTLSIMRDHHYWWRPDVLDAFMRTIGR
jgi:putative nucleotidyltransferase with HDIG domain